MQPIIFWDDVNVAHVGAHRITPEEVAEVFEDPNARFEITRKTRRPMVSGHTLAGRYIKVVYDELDDYPLRIYPVTAFAPGE